MEIHLHANMHVLGRVGVVLLQSLVSPRCILLSSWTDYYSVQKFNRIVFWFFNNWNIIIQTPSFGISKTASSIISQKFIFCSIDFHDNIRLIFWSITKIYIWIASMIITSGADPNWIVISIRRVYVYITSNIIIVFPTFSISTGYCTLTATVLCSIGFWSPASAGTEGVAVRSCVVINLKIQLNNHLLQ